MDERMKKFLKKTLDDEITAEDVELCFPNSPKMSDRHKPIGEDHFLRKIVRGAKLVNKNQEEAQSREGQ